MRQYAFIDYVTQAYLLVVAGLILIGHNHTVAHWQALVAAHLVGVVLIHALLLGHASHPGSRALDFLRHFYPIILYTGFYRETGMLNRMFVADYLDAHFIQLDQRLFGFQPCLSFMDRLPYLWISEIFYGAYFSYYLMIFGVGLALYLRDRRQFFHYVSVASFVFYVCYLTYICLPVMGPRAFFREIDGFRLPDEVQAYAATPTYPDSVKAGACYQLMAWVYRHFEGPGAAFPSSHVAIATVTLWFSFLYLRRIRFYHLAVVTLLCLSTVYGRYHYVIDVLAGILTTLTLVPLGNYLYARSQRADPAAPPAHTSGTSCRALRQTTRSPGAS